MNLQVSSNLSCKNLTNSTFDLDSLCSAVVLAYLRTYASSSESNTLYIPLSNLSRGDLSLRPELASVLSHANLKPSDLITLSDLPPKPRRLVELPPEKTRWLLVDHNAMQGGIKDLYSKRVIGCIDHHEEENKVPQDCGEEPRVIRKTGSCSSLVVDYCKEAWDALSANPKMKETTAWDVELSFLALGPIVVDTTNLTNTFVTPIDIEAAEYVESLLKDKLGNKFNREEYFKEVVAAKEDIGGLSLPDILRKDYKQWTEAGTVNLGISSVVKDVAFLIEKAGSREKLFVALKEFATERDLSIVSIMTTSHNEGQFKRELLAWAMNDKGVKAVKKFEEDSGEQLRLRTWGDGSLNSDHEKQWRRCWWQDRIDNSRKQVAPLMRNAILNGSSGRL